jgi:hypothetical protein
MDPNAKLKAKMPRNTAAMLTAMPALLVGPKCRNT